MSLLRGFLPIKDRDDEVYVPDPLGRVGRGRRVPRRDPFGRVMPDRDFEDFRKAWRSGADLGDLFAGDPFALGRPVGTGGDNRRGDVARVETALGRTGHLDLSRTDGPTGYPGSRLVDATKRFQKENGLEVDGVIRPGGETIAALARRLAARAPAAGPAAPSARSAARTPRAVTGTGTTPPAIRRMAETLRAWDRDGIDWRNGEAPGNRNATGLHAAETRGGVEAAEGSGRMSEYEDPGPTTAGEPQKQQDGLSSAGDRRAHHDAGNASPESPGVGMRLSDEAVRHLAENMREAIDSNDIKRLTSARNALVAYSPEDRQRIVETVPKVGPNGEWRRNVDRALRDLWNGGDDRFKETLPIIRRAYPDPKERKHMEGLARQVADGYVLGAIEYAPTEVLREQFHKMEKREDIKRIGKALGAVGETDRSSVHPKANQHRPTGEPRKTSKKSKTKTRISEFIEGLSIALGGTQVGPTQEIDQLGDDYYERLREELERRNALPVR